MGFFSDLGFGNMFSGLSGGLIMQVLIYGVVGAVVFLIILLSLFIYIRDKLKYKIPVTAIMPKQSGGFKEITALKGGSVKTRKGVSDFEIKIPFKWRKKKLGYMPNLSLSSADDRLYFLVVGDGVIWQQCLKYLEGDKDTGEIKIMIEPIPIDMKTITINNLHDIENMQEANKLRATSIAIGAFLLMVIIHAVFLYVKFKS